jgi:hypothetical protein
MKFALVIASLSLFATLPAAALVERGKEGNLTEFVSPVPGERVCFSRAYSTQHLAKHPRQTVSAIAFYLTYFQHEPDVHNPGGQRNYYYRLSVSFRDRPGETFKTMGDCHPGKGSISCTVECDGGGVRVQWRKKPESILIDFADMYGVRLSVCGGDERDEEEEASAETENEREPEAMVLTPGEDDKSFLLTRAKDAECPEYEEW